MKVSTELQSMTNGQMVFTNNEPERLKLRTMTDAWSNNTGNNHFYR